MLFNSPIFIFVFFPVTLGLWSLARTYCGVKAGQAFLVCSSIVFYGYWNPKYIWLVLGSIAVNYLLGSIIFSKKGTRRTLRTANLLFILGVIINLSILSYYKYANFFIETVVDLSGTNLTLVHVVLPIGISFFTFQQIAFLSDMRAQDAEKPNWIQYSLFVVFFPQLIAGPIVHHKQVLPQFKDGAIFVPKAENMTIGLTIFTIGLFKKLVIADTFSLTASPVFAAAEAGSAITFFDAWIGALSYTFQIYFDFSGYSDMAIGLARCFGVRLPINFHSPYQATSIIDFWRRWHMTLSQFLRDYLYVPLGGSRCSSARRFSNLMITMLLGGLWHGAGWTFIAWGGLHGTYLMINHAWRHLTPKHNPRLILRAVYSLITFIGVVIAWVFFRSESFTGASNLLRAMVQFPAFAQDVLGPAAATFAQFGVEFGGGDLSTQHQSSIFLLIITFGFVCLSPNTQQIMSSVVPAWDYTGNPRIDRMAPSPLCNYFSSNFRWKPTVIWGVWIGLLGFASLASLNRVSAFLYFQF